jgi:ribonuclease HI
VYSIFTEEGNTPLEQINLEDDLWHMHFDVSHSNEGNGAGIILVSPVGKIHNLSYRLEFGCSNNVTEFEALLLGIGSALNIGCSHLSFFGDSELVVNLIRRVFSPRNKLMEQYTQIVWALISNLLSFNITHVKREFNSMVDRLTIFAASSNQKYLPHRPDCSFQTLYRSHIPDNVESWRDFPNDEIIYAFIQDEPLKLKEMASIEDDNIPKGLTPLESLFSLGDVGNKEKRREGESRRKVGGTISLNIGALEISKSVKEGVQCSNKKEMRSSKPLGRFQNIFAWSYEDLRGFYPDIIHHTIKPARQKQTLVNSALNETIQRELGILLKVGIIFLAHPEWVSNWVPKTTDRIRTCFSIRTSTQAIMRNPFLPFNIGIIL